RAPISTLFPYTTLFRSRVVSNFLAQAMRGEPLTVYGDGKQTRSFCFVSDEVEGLCALLESDHVGPMNIGNPTEFTMLELAELVRSEEHTSELQSPCNLV